MFTNEQHFRVLKIFCILAVISSAEVALKVKKPCTGLTLTQCFVIAMGAWAIASGFIIERRILSKPYKSGRSTLLGRWRAGNLVRVMSATSVALWGLILRENGGPAWLAYLYAGIGALLLLIWRPTSSPQFAGESSR